MAMEHTLSCGKQHGLFVGVYSPGRELVPWRSRDEYARARRNRLRAKKYIVKKHNFAPKLAAKYMLARKTRHYLESALSELSAAPVAGDLEQRFRELADAWQRETAHLSSTAKRVLNSNYQAIMALGPPVIRLLLRDLRENRRDWFWALHHLAQDDPITTDDIGNKDRMIAAWEEWGRQRRII
ncbi:MAG: hypothetical protein ACHP9S_01560 [Terriglobales bacterium]